MIRDPYPRSLESIGFPHYLMWANGHLLNTLTGKESDPPPKGEVGLFDVNGKRHRFRSCQLVEWIFNSPYGRYNPWDWANMAPLGFSRYDITVYGEVYSRVMFKYLVGNISFDGYYRVCVVNDQGHQRTEVISRLVAKMFIPNPENKPEVDHINGDKSNNSIYNLRWVHGWENVQYARENNQRKSTLSDETIHAICHRLEQGNTVKSIMNELDVPKHAVLGIKSGCHNRISKDYLIPRNKHF